MTEPMTPESIREEIDAILRNAQAAGEPPSLDEILELVRECGRQAYRRGHDDGALGIESEREG